MSDTNSRATRYLELLKTAAEKHHTTITDTRAVYEAGVILAHEDQTAQMVAGERIDIATYLRLGEELAKLIPPPAPVEVKIQFVNPTETMCPECGCQFDPDTPERTIEKKHAAAIAALPPPAPAAQTSDNTTASEVKAAALVSAPPPPPPPAAPRNPSMTAWMNAHGKRYGCPDPGPDPASKYNQGYLNSAPSCWTGYQDGRRQYGGVQPDPNPSFHSDGSPRRPYEPSY